MPKTPLNTTIDAGFKMRLEHEAAKSHRSVSDYVNSIFRELCDLADDKPILDYLTALQPDEKGDRE